MVASTSNKRRNANKIIFTVCGRAADTAWQSTLEFQHANNETIYCRPSPGGEGSGPLSPHAVATRIAILPPMSGLASEEAELRPGRIQTLIGEGRTAEVLRNLCLLVHESDPSGWEEIADRMSIMFGVKLELPKRDKARGIVEMGYFDVQRETRLDLSAAGRGQLQTLLLLAYLKANPGSTLMLDEPDAHLEIIRQRTIYNAISEVASNAGSQIIAASHSEIVLQEAAQRDLVIAFVGAPHRIDDRGSQVLKSLRDIGFDQYYQASKNKFVLYVEGATDLEFLRAFSKVLGHRSLARLNDVFVHYVGNIPQKARDHFYGLREAEPNLRGYALFDRLDMTVDQAPALPMRMWRKNEIENYVMQREVLLRFAENPDGTTSEPDLVSSAEESRRREVMDSKISELENALRVTGKDAWSAELKSSDEFLTPLFRNFYSDMNLPNEMAKTNFHRIAQIMRREEIDPEIGEVLDAIAAAMGT
jgi:AAA domain, putative AbiEii toxin, Type IV TA system